MLSVDVAVVKGTMVIIILVGIIINIIFTVTDPSLGSF